VESQKRPFLNQKEGSAKLLSLREPVTPIPTPFLKRGKSKWADSDRPRRVVNQEDIIARTGSDRWATPNRRTLRGPIYRV